MQTFFSMPSAVVFDLDRQSVLMGTRSITHMRGPSVLCYRQIHQTLFSGPPGRIYIDHQPKSTTALLGCRCKFSTWQLVGGSWSYVIRCECSRPCVNTPKCVWENPALLKNANVTLTVETWVTIYHDTNSQEERRILKLLILSDHKRAAKLVWKHWHDEHGLS